MVSKWWLLIALAFGVLGGILAYSQIRKRNKTKAVQCLILGFISTLIGLLILKLTR